MYTFTLFCRFEQKVYVAQWLTSRTFNHSLLFMCGFNTHQRRHYYFFTRFQFCFRHFLQFACDSTGILLQVRVSVSMRKPFFFIVRCICVFYTYSMHPLDILPVYCSCFGRKKWDFVLLYVIPPRYSHFSICSNNRILIIMCKLCTTWNGNWTYTLNIHIDQRIHWSFLSRFLLIW